MEKRKITVLLAEDNRAMRGMCERLLSGMGYEVRQAADLDAAIKLAEEQAFDLVLTDIRMDSSTDGVMLAEHMRNRFPGTDVILMTGEPSIETAIPALKCGVSDYILKPFSTEYFSSVIRNCLEKRGLRAELNRERMMKLELQDAYAELKKVEKLKDGFLARVNHELRTPVAMALMASDLLGRKAETAEQRDLWVKMDRAIKRLQTVVEELLLYTRTVQGGLTLRKTRVDLRLVLKEVLCSYQILADDRALKVELVCEPSLELTADAELIKVAVAYLFLNAVRFNKQGGSINIEASRENGSARIVFRDSGIGIPGHALPRIFDSFYQVAEHMTREVGGLGLGLATVKRIVDGHDGCIAVESEEGKGSAFTVTLPLN